MKATTVRSPVASSMTMRRSAVGVPPMVSSTLRNIARAPLSFGRSVHAPSGPASAAKYRARAAASSENSASMMRALRSAPGIAQPADDAPSSSFVLSAG